MKMEHWSETLKEILEKNKRFCMHEKERMRGKFYNFLTQKFGFHL